ncbi:hypothetical protein KBI23_09400 [bacterium]|nr:hypothetical protein [bacterium]MBP9810533.1 hypothetical protein [bacterium]
MRGFIRSFSFQIKSIDPDACQSDDQTIHNRAAPRTKPRAFSGVISNAVLTP